MKKEDEEQGIDVYCKEAQTHKHRLQGIRGTKLRKRKRIGVNKANKENKIFKQIQFEFLNFHIYHFYPVLKK